MEGRLLPRPLWECLQGTLEWQSVSSRAGKEPGSKCMAGWPSLGQPLPLSRPQPKTEEQGQWELGWVGGTQLR